MGWPYSNEIRQSTDGNASSEAKKKVRRLGGESGPGISVNIARCGRDDSRK